MVCAIHYPVLDNQPIFIYAPANTFKELKDLVPHDVDFGPTTGPGRSLDQVKRWLEKCEASHECVAHTQINNSNYQYPARLVDTGTEQEPRIQLRITKEQHPQEPYLTLSHCWGLTPTVKLLTGNMEDMKKEIRYDALSKTFQQAVVTTRILGFRYIWIDSLCIVQDSIDDWREEGLKMTDVYTGSYLNLAAAHSKDGHGGLFQMRDPGKLQPIYINTDLEEVGNHRFFLDDESFWTRGVDQAPLHQRGWVLQERTLAPRTVHFGGEQIFWECSRRTYSENYPQGGLYGGRFGVLGRIRLPDATDYNRKGEGESAWGRALEVYSRCAITQPGDKLVAIAGIAQRLQALTGNSYAAGLWREEMPNNLTWYVVSPRAATRPATYRAPSWSWAALDAGIKPCVAAAQRIEVSVVDCQVSNVLTSPFSQVTDAYLDLKWTRLFAATLNWDDQGRCSTIVANETRPQDVGDYQSGLIAEDLGSENMYPDVLPPPGAVDVFLLPVNQDYFSTFLVSLVLIPANGQGRGVYQRFGVHKAASQTVISWLSYEKNSQEEWYVDVGEHAIRVV